MTFKGSTVLIGGCSTYPWLPFQKGTTRNAGAIIKYQRFIRNTLETLLINRGIPRNFGSPVKMWLYPHPPNFTYYFTYTRAPVKSWTPLNLPSYPYLSDAPGGECHASHNFPNNKNIFSINLVSLLQTVLNTWLIAILLLMLFCHTCSFAPETAFCIKLILLSSDLHCDLGLSFKDMFHEAFSAGTLTEIYGCTIARELRTRVGIQI